MGFNFWNFKKSRALTLRVGLKNFLNFKKSRALTLRVGLKNFWTDLKGFLQARDQIGLRWEHPFVVTRLWGWHPSRIIIVRANHSSHPVNCLKDHGLHMGSLSHFKEANLIYTNLSFRCGITHHIPCVPLCTKSEITA